MQATVTVAREQGPRDYQEDYCAHIPIREKERNVGDLLAVFDGHVSEIVSKFCAENVEKFFAFLGTEKTEEALKNLVEKLNAETINHHSGSTVSIALITYDPLKVSVAVIGDSPVVVYDKNGVLHASPEHNARSNPKERKMAEERGGYYLRGYMYPDPCSERGLQMTRALGNAYLGKVLLREPEIYTISNPQWVLTASDGLFDPGHADTEHLLKEIEGYAEKFSDAETLMDWARRRGLKDNATALVWSLERKLAFCS